jgi:hypothetical protein
MAIRFHVRFDLRSFERAMSDVAERQTPFATALALTWTAQDAQAVLRGGLERHFTIRDRWTTRGIRIEPAKKRWLSAAVGSVDSYMARQVEGGTKSALDAADLAVPLGIRKHPKQRTGRSRWPGALLQKPGHFVAPLPGGGKRLAAHREMLPRGNFSQGGEQVVRGDGAGELASARRHARLVCGVAGQVAVAGALPSRRLNSDPAPSSFAMGSRLAARFPPHFAAGRPLPSALRSRSIRTLHAGADGHGVSTWKHLRGGTRVRAPRRRRTTQTSTNERGAVRSPDPCRVGWRHRREGCETGTGSKLNRSPLGFGLGVGGARGPGRREGAP